MTTSRPCSTKRFAFSITISATCTWRTAGSSKVEDTTSPFTERCTSVTSSGRSSLSSPIREHSRGVAGVRPDRGALALADRRHDVDDAGRKVLRGGVVVLHVEPLVRIERREVV